MIAGVKRWVQGHIFAETRLTHGMKQADTAKGEAYLQHNMHLARWLQVLILWPAKGVGSGQHDVQHHPT
jgi:hypothetical protein